jgi:hypothetical protein
MRAWPAPCRAEAHFPAFILRMASIFLPFKGFFAIFEAGYSKVWFNTAELCSAKAHFRFIPETDFFGAYFVLEKGLICQTKA